MRSLKALSYLTRDVRYKHKVIKGQIAFTEIYIF